MIYESEQNQNLSNEVLSPEEKEAQGILLAQEITALRKKDTKEANQTAITKAQKLERLFAPQALPENEPELYTNTELTLEDGTKVLVKPDNFSIQKDGKTHNLFPGSTFKLLDVRVRFKGLVDTSDLNTENHNKPVIEIDIASGGGLHQIIDPTTIENEGSIFWNWEVLTPEVIEQQLTQWQTVYREIGLTDINLPSQEALLTYLSDNQEFVELMQKKEKQGFTQMVIAPLELKKLINLLDTKVIGRGGTDQDFSYTWKEILKDEGKTRYFVNPGTDQGITMNQIQAKPENFGVLNGCFISFVESRQNIVKGSEPDIDDSTGRKAIKDGLNVQAYQNKYFSGIDPHYQGEQAMIPQEWLASFAADLYNKYLKENRRMDAIVIDLMDSGIVTWFISTSFPDCNGLPYASWGSGFRRLSFLQRGPDFPDVNLAPRSSVRKKS